MSSATLKYIGPADRMMLGKIPIAKHDKTFIGREVPEKSSDENFFVLNSTAENQDRMLSRTHALIEPSSTDAGNFKITDLKSTNGLLVNGKRADVHTLIEGDIITFGGASEVAYGEKPINERLSSYVYRFQYNSPQ